MMGIYTLLGAPDDVHPTFVVEQLIIANPQAGASIQQDALRVTRGEVAEAAAASLGRSAELDDVAGSIDATPDETTNAIRISTSAEDTGPAIELVTAFSDAFLASKNGEPQRQRDRQLAEVQSQLDKATAELVAFDATYPTASTPGASVSADPQLANLASMRQQLLQSQENAQQTLKDQQSQNVELPYSALGSPSARRAESSLLGIPSSPVVRGGLLGFVGLLLGAGLVLILERVNPRVDTREELAEAIGLPVIAEVGYLSRAKRSADHDGRLLLEGVWAEPYRRVRSAVQFVQSGRSTESGDESARVFLITSAQPGEGKSTTSALTAIALAELDVPTVVIGADFRRPTVDRLLGHGDGPSIQDMAVLAPDRPTADEVVRMTAHDNLYLASGGPSTREVAQLILATKELVVECRRRGATVIIDSSPLRAANDTIDLLDVVDEVILVVRSGEATVAGLTESVEALRQLDTVPMGVVLVGTPGLGQLQAYYDGYYTQQNATVRSSSG